MLSGTIHRSIAVLALLCLAGPGWAQRGQCQGSQGSTTRSVRSRPPFAVRQTGTPQTATRQLNSSLQRLTALQQRQSLLQTALQQTSNALTAVQQQQTSPYTAQEQAVLVTALQQRQAALQSALQQVNDRIGTLQQQQSLQTSTGIDTTGQTALAGTVQGRALRLRGPR